MSDSYRRGALAEDLKRRSRRIDMNMTKPSLTSKISWQKCISRAKIAIGLNYKKRSERSFDYNIYIFVRGVTSFCKAAWLGVQPIRRTTNSRVSDLLINPRPMNLLI